MKIPSPAEMAKQARDQASPEIQAAVKRIVSVLKTSFDGSRSVVVDLKPGEPPREGDLRRVSRCRLAMRVRRFAARRLLHPLRQTVKLQQC